MIERLAAYDREYRRNLTWALPMGALSCALLILAVPGTLVRSQDPGRVGYQGTLKVLPEVDILDEEESAEQRTAAPRGAPAADFVVVDFAYAEVPEAPPLPRPSTPAEKKLDTRLEFSEQDRTALDIRTTAHPVLAASQYELLYMERPVYPREALEMGLEGDVEILMLIDTHGRVSQASVVQPNRIPILERAARAAVMKSLFRVYLVDGKPTPFWVRVPIEFRIEN